MLNKCTSWIFLIYINLAILSYYPTNGFTNYLTELFSDLRFGSIDKDYLKQKLAYKKLKCLQGSYAYNGSCYFISDLKYSASFGLDAALENFMKVANQNSKLASSLDSTPLGTAIELASLPKFTTWKNALNYCTQLNNDSSLVSFNNNQEEHDFIIDLLKKLHFPNLFYQMNLDNSERPSEDEREYHIGIVFNNSVWKWIDGTNISNSLISKYSLDKIEYNSFRTCSYLNLRSDGEVKIETTNCNKNKPFICKYILDRCYNNTSCGPNGECINLPHKKAFECRCRLFYDGKTCRNWSNQGIQMLIAVGLVIGAFCFVIMIKIIHRIKFRIKLSEKNAKKERELKYEETHRYSVYRSSIYKPGYAESPLLPQQINLPNVNKNRISAQIQQFKCNLPVFISVFKKKIKLLLIIIISFIFSASILLTVSYTRSKMIEYKIKKFADDVEKNPEKNIAEIDKDNSTSYLTRILNFDLCKSVKDQFFEDYIIIYFSLTITGFLYFWNAFKLNRDRKNFCKCYKTKSKGLNRTSLSFDKNHYENDDLSLTDEKRIRQENLSTMLKFKNRCTRACGILCSRVKKFTCCGVLCMCGVEFPIPMNPFTKRNRFLTGIIYAAYSYNILKIFEYLLIGDQYFEAVDNSRNFFKNFSLANITSKNLSQITDSIKDTAHSITNYAERGILMDLLKQITNVFIIGVRYYPVLLCVELKRKSKLCYFICTLYVLLMLIYYVYMNIFCLVSALEAIKEAKSQKSSVSANVSFLGTNIQIFRPESRMVKVVKPISNNSDGQTSFGTTILQATTRLTTNSQIRARQIVLNAKIDNFVNKTQNFGSTFKSNLSDELMGINKSAFYNNIMYEKFIFYAVLCLITLNMITEFSILIIKSIKSYYRRKASKPCSCKKCCCNKNGSEQSSEENVNKSYYKNNTYAVGVIGKVNNEIIYTRTLLKPNRKPISYVKYLFEKYVYKNCPYFRYSKQFINTNIIAFILLYYLSALIIRKSNLFVQLFVKFLLLIINSILRMDPTSELTNILPLNSKSQITALLESLHSAINIYIIIACLSTTFVYVVQLLLGIRNYHKHVLNAYKGVYIDIPSPRQFSNTKLVSSSLHYSGYAIGYLLWGYIILFKVVVIIMLIVKFLIKFYFITENIAKVVLPILTIFLFKKILIWYLSHYFLTNKSQNKFSLKNNKLYFILNHFNFFFDCFLGSFVCFMRVAKSSIAALFLMPRLDYSIFGRYLEKTDMGFISYVTFIHMEVNQTHPVKLAFSELLIQSLKDDRSARAKRARTKWALLYTLFNNPQLKKERKRFIRIKNFVPKVETFEDFLKRNMKKMFSNDDTKKKSKSTSCLVDELKKEEQDQQANITYRSSRNNEIRTSTINYRLPPALPPVPAKRNLISYSQNNNFMLSNDLTYNTTLNNSTRANTLSYSSQESNLYDH